MPLSSSLRILRNATFMEPPVWNNYPQTTLVRLLRAGFHDLQGLVEETKTGPYPAGWSHCGVAVCVPNEIN